MLNNKNDTGINYIKTNDTKSNNALTTIIQILLSGIARLKVKKENKYDNKKEYKVEFKQENKAPIKLLNNQ